MGIQFMQKIKGNMRMKKEQRRNFESGISRKRERSSKRDKRDPICFTSVATNKIESLMCVQYI